jgi:hypothetical protein
VSTATATPAGFGDWDNWAAFAVIADRLNLEVAARRRSPNHPNRSTTADTGRSGRRFNLRRI